MRSVERLTRSNVLPASNYCDRVYEAVSDVIGDGGVGRDIQEMMYGSESAHSPTRCVFLMLALAAVARALWYPGCWRLTACALLSSQLALHILWRFGA